MVDCSPDFLRLSRNYPEHAHMGLFELLSYMSNYEGLTPSEAAFIVAIKLNPDESAVAKKMVELVATSGSGLVQRYASIYVLGGQVPSPTAEMG
jgi:hypothetical protein